ncbi:hypothetical protein DV515_00002824 [Chloebia gouldiae]|uniref:Uncharacterized protein n=1 Tax=Chloebia gouldiae TaxID=44316 RepID=A0A3L8SWD7_CHLGU|nr:hypothetical protein DV515_00002824 [Chloebia gouldiae]
MAMITIMCFVSQLVLSQSSQPCAVARAALEKTAWAKHQLKLCPRYRPSSLCCQNTQQRLWLTATCKCLAQTHYPHLSFSKRQQIITANALRSLLELPSKVQHTSVIETCKSWTSLLSVEEWPQGQRGCGFKVQKKHSGQIMKTKTGFDFEGRKALPVALELFTAG